MVDSKPHSVDSTRIKFQNIFETIDMTQRKTKIVCTIGAGCGEVDEIVKLLDAGMNVARLDFAPAENDTKVSYRSEANYYLEKLHVLR